MKKFITMLGSSLLYVLFSGILFAEDIKPKQQLELFQIESQQLYESIFVKDTSIEKLNYNVFASGLRGFLNLKEAQQMHHKSHILTICDFSLSGNSKRMWVIDLKQKKVLSNNLVSHGKNSGEEFATVFSNKLGSYQSSLGFYITGETYEGANGYSLRLEGMDWALNDLAYERAIVMHGANYCSEDFIAEHGRLGRSFGCPAVPVALNERIVNWIKDGSCLYIHADNSALEQSKWLNKVPNLILAHYYNS